MKKMIILLLVFSSASIWAADFTLTSPSLKDKGTLPNRNVFNSFGCTGENVSPALQWKNAPAGTKSFAVIVYDPDAPTGSGWWHWTVFNIPANATEIAEGAGTEKSTKLPKGASQGRTDFGNAAFGGACPPVGDKPHRYIFTVFALKADKLELDANSSGALVGYYLNGNSLGKATMTAMFGRK